MQPATAPPPSPAPGDAASLCPRCGYNLTGLPASARCPECGLPTDPLNARRANIPWVYRRTLGRAVTFARTVWLATVRPSALAAEVERPVGYRDALTFRLLACAAATLPVAALLGAIMYATGGTGFLAVLSTERIAALMFAGPQDDPTIPWLYGLAVPWESGATLPPVMPLALYLATVLATGVTTYWFHPRRLPVVKQNRAVALSHYASAPVVLLPLPLGAWLGMAVLQQAALDRGGRSLARPIDLLAVVGAVTAVGAGFLLLRSALVLLRRATGARLGKLLLAMVLLPLAWALCAAVALVGFPWVVGLVRLMVTSRQA